jgi:hypothetical protein
MMPRLCQHQLLPRRVHPRSPERIEVLWTNYPLGKGKTQRIMQEERPLRKPYATRIRTLITCLTCSNELYLIHAPYRPFRHWCLRCDKPTIHEPKGGSPKATSHRPHHSQRAPTRLLARVQQTKESRWCRIK